MLHQEQTTYKCNVDYLNHSSSPVIINVKPSHRVALCQWAYNVINTIKNIDKSIAVIGIQYFDRFMSSKLGSRFLIGSREFQLAFIGCLIVSLKAREGMVVEVDFITNVLCNNLYSQREILAIEIEVLIALEWRLNGPTPQDFVGYFLDLYSYSSMFADERVVETLKQSSLVLVEQAMTDYALALQTPSSIAYAALLSCMDESFDPLDKFALIRSVTMVSGIEANQSGQRFVRDRLVQVMQMQGVGLARASVVQKSCSTQYTKSYVMSRNKGNSCRIGTVSPSASMPRRSEFDEWYSGVLAMSRHRQKKNHSSPVSTLML
jgi:hypothetical protein